MSTATPLAPVTQATSAPPMLLDDLMPRFDAVRVEHRVIGGSIEVAYEAVRHADFLRAWRESATVRALFAARSIGERAIAAARRRAFAEPPTPATMRLAELPIYGDWVLLGAEPPSEIAFGVIGRFWAGETVWLEIDASDFATFDRPGFARIACNFSLRPYGASRTLVSYECRTQTTDETSRAAFMRYWRPLSRFIGVVMRSQLRVVASQAGQADQTE